MSVAVSVVSWFSDYRRPRIDKLFMESGRLAAVVQGGPESVGDVVGGRRVQVRHDQDHRAAFKR